MVLISPGVDLSVINESFYGSAGAGTIPLIVFATAANKASPSGSGTAPQSLTSEAGKLFLATSQRELIQSFGNPKFYSTGGTALHGHELNEYGLHAAYSYLGVSNRAYVLRADIDLAQLEASDSSPRGAPISGTYWLDLGSTRFGLFQSNGNASAGLAWQSKTPLIAGPADIDGTFIPKPAFGVNGEFAVVPLTTGNFIYEKIATQATPSGEWFRIGSTAWKSAKPTILRGSSSASGTPANSQTIIINGVTTTFTTAANMAAVASQITASAVPNITATVDVGALILTHTLGADIVISGTGLAALGLAAGTTKGVTAQFTNTAQYPGGSVASDLWVKLSSPNKGAEWSVKRYNASTAQWVSQSVPFFPFNSMVQDGTAGKDTAAIAAMNPTTGALYVGFDTAAGLMQLRRFSGSGFSVLSYLASTDEPTTDPEDGALWFNADFRADIMIGSGTKWEGYQNRYPDTDPAGVLISGSAPVEQTDGTALEEHDLWLDSSDLENYPRLYRWNATTLRWGLIDNTDQTTPFGIVFADARENSGTTFTGIPNAGDYTFNSELAEDMLLSDFLDPDAPDPRMYPDGVLLFNMRYSTYNVKVWRPQYFLDGGYDINTDYTAEEYTVGDPAYTFPPTLAGRWVTTSGNRVDGAPNMGRKAQRALVVRALQEAVSENQDIRSEIIFYNLLAAPGYPELIDELSTLNVDQRETAFIVGDAPARLKPNGLAIQNWATNAFSASSNGEDGLLSANPYVGIYYPWGLGTNIDGQDVMIPASTIALRTIAYSDQVAYPWLAPAGFQRGIVSNATSVGYLTDEGEYRAVVLNQGQRDSLYSNRINPIAYMGGAGLVVYGQKTLEPVASAMDRINVARLVNYIRQNIDDLMKPFIFQPNDTQTRDGARLAAERFLLGLVGLRGLEDFAVLCDETNNSPERRSRNELWVDIAIKPIKSVEFIYVPLRIRDTGDSLEF